MAVLGINRTESDKEYGWSDIEPASHPTNPNIETEERIWKMRDDVIEARYAYGSSELAVVDVYYGFMPAIDQMAQFAVAARNGEDVKDKLYAQVRALQQLSEWHSKLTNRIDRVLERAYRQLEESLDDFYGAESDTQYPSSVQDIL